jgi:hypothetical protein
MCLGWRIKKRARFQGLERAAGVKIRICGGFIGENATSRFNFQRKSRRGLPPSPFSKLDRGSRRSPNHIANPTMDRYNKFLAEHVLTEDRVVWI